MNAQAMFRLSYGLFIITAHEGDRDNGCITNTVSQVTTTPNQISLTVNKSNYTHDMISNTGLFNVSVLAENATFDTIRHFGFQSGRDTNKFADFPDCKRTENGLFLVTAGTNAWLSAKVTKQVDLGTHTQFIAEVTDGDILSDLPSATYTYYQEKIKPAPARPATAKKTVWVCKVCGYMYEGETLPSDFLCPLCKHGAEDFEKMEV